MKYLELDGLEYQLILKSEFIILEARSSSTAMLLWSALSVPCLSLSSWVSASL